MKLEKEPVFLPASFKDKCLHLFKLIENAGGKPQLVGGSVRDALLGEPVKDVDIEVFGLPVRKLEDLLSDHYSVDEVGKAFSVFKIRGIDIDISLPRRESKSGEGHRGFEIEGDPNMGPKEAAGRRDFTVNAISWDPIENRILDPFGGLKDLERGILRHTTEKFSEDPLRVLRAMQLAARFRFQVSADTVELCRHIEPENLPPERVFEEFRKLLLKGRKISKGLDFLRSCDWLKYFPELNFLVGCKQEPEWHPEGDVWVHTLHCMDAFAEERTEDDWEDLIVGFATLCHDLGKPFTTVVESGRIRSPRHESAGEGPTRSFLQRMTQHKELIDSVIPLVSTHLRPLELYRSKAGDSAIRRLARKVKRIDRLVRVAQADMKGRPPLKVERFDAGEWLISRAKALAVVDSAPKPIVLGRHLIKLGQEPGPSFGPLLEQCYEAQLDGEFADLVSGMKTLQRILSERK